MAIDIGVERLQRAMRHLGKVILAAAAALPVFAQAGNCPDSAVQSTASRLAVRGVQLGSTSAPCHPEMRMIRDATGAVSTQQMSCTFGDAQDSTRVTFSADGKHVVRVMRTQFLKSTDPATSAVLKEAMRFYGSPAASDLGSDLVTYGNAYNVVRKGKAVDLNRNSCGVGLLITGQACGDGSFGLPDCKGLGVRYVNFDLVNNAELEKALADGARAIKEVEKRKLTSLKF